MIYKKKADGSAKSNNSTETSQTGREALIDAVDSKETLHVRTGDRGNLMVHGPDNNPSNNIELDRAETNALIGNVQGGLDPTAMGWAMSFFHELFHTPIGGGLPDTNIRAKPDGLLIK